MRTVNVRQLRMHLARLLDDVAAGQEIVVVTRSGTPVARLVPAAGREPRVPGIAKGRVTEAFSAPLSDEELDAWEQ